MRDWSTIHDPTGEIDFHLDWTEVSSQYEPQEIQKMIDESGVQEMVRIVNEHFWLISSSKPLMLARVGNRKAVVLR